MTEKDALTDEGFHSWKRLHFLSFIKAMEKYGRDALDKVAAEIADHTEEQVREYAAVFLDRYRELKGQLHLCVSCCFRAICIFRESGATLGRSVELVEHDSSRSREMC